MSIPLNPIKPHKKSKSKEKSKHKDKEPRQKEARNEKKSKSSKGKAKETGEFIQTSSRLSLSLPPYYTNSPLRGAISVLDGLVMRYLPSLQGVLLSHSSAHFIEEKALVQAEAPFMKCTVGFDAVVWRPIIGMKLYGHHSISSPSHMSLLVHRTFNVSIPSSHIPQHNQPRGSQSSKDEDPDPDVETFHFEFAEDSNEEMDPGTKMDVDVDVDENEILEGSGGKENEEHVTEERGHWISSRTGLPISGTDRSNPIEFTVIGLTIANSMLSLIGSLQQDPFNARHTFSAKEALTSHEHSIEDARKLSVDQMNAEAEADREAEAEDIEEVDKELSVHPEEVVGLDRVHEMDDIEEAWTQSQEQEQEPVTVAATEKPESKEGKKRKRKDKVSERAVNGPESTENPPKKKKKKKKAEGVEVVDAVDSVAVKGKREKKKEKRA